MSQSVSDHDALSDGLSDFLTDDFAEYNRNEADDYRNEHVSDEVAGLDGDPLHAKLISVADGSAEPFLRAIEAALDRAEAAGTITHEQNVELYTILYNALAVEYEDGEYVDPQEDAGEAHGE